MQKEDPQFQSSYIAEIPDARGYINYSAEKDAVWRILYERQHKLLPGRACQEHIDGLQKLQLTAEAIPQLPEVSEILASLTGWRVSPVAALISAKEFFKLLANRCFPAATFIRRLEELDYVKEPDIFHELFGHCPLLTQPVYADFMQAYAELVLSLPESEWPLLQRMFWFTVEFGLIKTAEGIRAYGGGILSSIKETVYCVESEEPQRQPFVPLNVMRTPYRIDRVQPIYFVIDSYQQLYAFVKSDIPGLLKETHRLGEFAPVFEVEPGNPNIHIAVC